MLKIPYEQIIEKILKEDNISEEDLKNKIDSKLKQLSGLVSKEGAAHIVANELGIKLLDATSGKLQIKNIVPGMRSVETVGKVLQTYELREFNTNNRQGKVASLMIGDETGKIRVVMWGSQAENINKIRSGDIIKVAGSYVKENNGFNELHLNEKSQIVINPEGEKIDIKAESTQRKQINQLNENDNMVEILATIVQVFEPRFFEVCPQCSKRLKAEEGSFLCQKHDKVEPDYSYVLNLVVDDGTENIRTVFFRDSMEKLLNLNKEKVMQYRENPQNFEEIKTDLLGSIIKAQGRVKKNMFFDRIEFVANNVSTNPDPDEEIKRLDQEMKKAEG